MDITAVDDLMCAHLYSEALAVLEAVPVAERDEALWLRVGRCHIAVGAWGDGIHAFERARALDGKNAGALQELFDAYLAVERRRQMRTIHRLCGEAGLPAWRLRLQEVQLLICDARVQDALADWLEGVALCPTPDDRAAGNWRVMDTLLRYGYAQEALAMIPESGASGEHLLMIKATAYSRLGLAADLAEVVDDAMEKGYSSPNWARYAARRAWAQGKRDEAVAILERRTAAFPGSGALYATLAVWLQAMGHGNRAVEYARLAMDVRPFMADVSVAAARVLWANGRRTKALLAVTQGAIAVIAAPRGVPQVVRRGTDASEDAGV
jgi:tetratricopeptide (TPR) repeat protein